MDKEIRNTGENFQETEFLKLKKPADDRIVLIEDLNENSDKIDKFCKDTENNKQNKEDITLPTTAKNIIGAIREIFVELWKIGSTTQFGRFKVGKNLSVDANGFLNGNPSYTHPSGNGNTHLPAGGAAGNIILWGSSGTGTWGKLKYADIVGTPTSLKNPYSLTLQFNGINQEGYNGEAAKTINITPAGIKAAEKVHKHSKEDITDLSLSKPLTIKFNGTSQGDYTGEVAKEINITPAGIGAEPVFNKNSAFNKNFGTVANTVLDGAKLAETLGIPYGGSLNTTSAKVVGTAYYDNTTKKTYKCTVANSLNYADASKFEAISNNDLLAKLQNFSMIPDYSNPQKLVWRQNNTIPKDGIIQIYFYASNDLTITITINGSNFNYRTRDASADRLIYPVGKGDIVYCSGAQDSQSLIFFPYR